jgi:hypothetical protein
MSVFFVPSTTGDIVSFILNACSKTTGRQCQKIRASGQPKTVGPEKSAHNEPEPSRISNFVHSKDAI